MDFVRRWSEKSEIGDNNVRLNSAVGYVTPKDMLGGRQAEIHAQGDRKLEESPKTAADSSSEGRVKNEDPRSPLTGEIDNFRVADDPEPIRQRCAVNRG